MLAGAGFIFCFLPIAALCFFGFILSVLFGNKRGGTYQGGYYPPHHHKPHKPVGFDFGFGGGGHKPSWGGGGGHKPSWGGGGGGHKPSWGGGGGHKPSWGGGGGGFGGGGASKKW